MEEIENLIQQAIDILTKADDKITNLINNNILEKCDFNKIYNILLLLKEIEFNIKGEN